MIVFNDNITKHFTSLRKALAFIEISKPSQANILNKGEDVYVTYQAQRSIVPAEYELVEEASIITS